MVVSRKIIVCLLAGAKRELSIPSKTTKKRQPSKTTTKQDKATEDFKKPSVPVKKRNPIGS